MKEASSEIDQNSGVSFSVYFIVTNFDQAEECEIVLC